MRKIKLYLIVIYFIHFPSFAGKIPLEIINESFDVAIKLKGTAIYKNGQEEEEFEIKIPESNKKSHPTISTFLRERSICHLYLSLVLDKVDNDNDEDSLIDLATFKPFITSLLSLRIHLVKNKIVIEPAYNLPPKFSEN